MMENDDESGGYEILVHNLSHSDTVLEVNTLDNHFHANTIMARPKFSSFNKVCKLLDNGVEGDLDLIQFPLSRRETRDNETVYIEEKHTSCPAGFSFANASTTDCISISDISSLRFRKSDCEKLLENISKEVLESDGPKCRINALYFPLMALLLPKWMSIVDELHQNEQNKPNKVVLLITGAGTPADSRGHFMDNSTEHQGSIIKKWMSKIYPEIKVVLLNSDLNIFRYDDNIEFVKFYMNPQIERFRYKAAQRFGGDWKKHFHLTMSFADGSSARTSAINAALRLYKSVMLLCC